MQAEPNECEGKSVGQEQKVDFGRDGHWSEYYSSGAAPAKPSPFAEFVQSSLDSPVKLLEVGCGNGRDASFFAGQGHVVSALDPSASAIDACRVADRNGEINYLQGTLPEVVNVLPNDFDVVYSRFAIHAMTLPEEERLLASLSSVLAPGARVFIECRSINDPMAAQGEVVSQTERISGHYRRFIVKDELEARLRSNGFKINAIVESSGLAVFGSEDPVVIRVEGELAT